MDKVQTIKLTAPTLIPTIVGNEFCFEIFTALPVGGRNSATTEMNFPCDPQCV